MIALLEFVRQKLHHIQGMDLPSFKRPLPKLSPPLQTHILREVKQIQMKLHAGLAYHRDFITCLQVADETNMLSARQELTHIFGHIKHLHTPLGTMKNCLLPGVIPTGQDTLIAWRNSMNIYLVFLVHVNMY